MFETAELGREISRTTYDRRIPQLRESLLIAQNRLMNADFQVIVVFAGVDGAGKGESVNLLNQWLDPRWIRNCAFDEPTQDELERPEYWRFWRALPNRGHIGILSSTWYSRPLTDRVFNIDDAARFESRLDEILAFEHTLADDGALFVKFWLHLGRDAQEKRFRQLSSDPLNSWRVTETDWEHWRRFDDFVKVGGRIINRTSTGIAPWHIIEGWDEYYRGLRVGELLLSALEDRLDRWDEEKSRNGASKKKEVPDWKGTRQDRRTLTKNRRGQITVLSRLDRNKKLAKSDYREQLVIHSGPPERTTAADSRGRRDRRDRVRRLGCGRQRRRHPPSHYRTGLALGPRASGRSAHRRRIGSALPVAVLATRSACGSHRDLRPQLVWAGPRRAGRGIRERG